MSNIFIERSLSFVKTNIKTRAGFGTSGAKFFAALSVLFLSAASAFGQQTANRSLFTDDDSSTLARTVFLNKKPADENKSDSAAPAANTRVVDADGTASATDCNAAGTAFTTIASAVAAANPGDTIKVCPGNYPESLSINKTLTLLGAQSGVDAGNGMRTGLPATESVISSDAGKSPLYLNANNIIVDGFTVQGNTDPNLFGTGILVEPTRTGTQLLNNIVQNNIIGIIPTSETTIRRNLIRNNNNPGSSGGTGIYNELSNSLTNLIIENNTISGNDNAGILMPRSPGTTNSVTISNNVMSGNGSAMVLFNISNATK